MQKARSIQKWFVEIGVEELDWPAQSPDLTSPPSNTNCEPGPISESNLTNALVAEWKPVPRAKFQYLMESLPRRVEAVLVAKWGDQLDINAHHFGMRRPHTMYTTKSMSPI